MSPDLRPVEHRWDVVEREVPVTDVQQLRDATMSIRTINLHATNNHESSGAAGGPTVSEKDLPNKTGFWWRSVDDSDTIEHQQKNRYFSVGTVILKVSTIATVATSTALNCD